MNRSTFCEIKYMNRLVVFFFKGRVYDWGWFQITDSHISTKIPEMLPPKIAEDIKGYISSKDTILSVKSSI